MSFIASFTTPNLIFLSKGVSAVKLGEELISNNQGLSL